MLKRMTGKVFNNPHLRQCFNFDGSSLRPLSSMIAKLMLAASGCLYFALRLRSIWTPRLWGDELFNYSLSQGSWLSIIKRTGLDMAHPPLFYLLLKPWVYVVGSSMSGLRVFTVAFSIAAIVPMLALCRELHFRIREIALASSLMAINSYLILYSYYLRPYSLLLFLTLCSHVAFVRFLRHEESEKRRALLILVAVNIPFVYTHYFAWLVVAAQYLWVVFMERRRLRRFTAAMAIIALSYLPWVGVLVYVSTQVSYTFWDQASWETPPNLQSLILLLRSFNGGFESAGLTLAGSAVFLTIVLLSMKNSALITHSSGQADEACSKPLVLLAWMTAFPVVVSLVASYAFTLIRQPRYVIVAAGTYSLLVAASAFRLRTPRARAVAVAFLLGWTAVAGFTDNLAEALHGPDAPSYRLAQDLSRAEARSERPIRIYGFSPYAAQGLRLAISITGERRFEIISCPVNAPLTDDYFWIALTEHDPLATARVSELSADPAYSLGEPISSGEPSQRHILIPVQRR